jgi:ribonuclease HI
MQNLILFADGGSRGNPGPAASGFIIYKFDNFNLTKIDSLENSNVVHEEGIFLGNTTNNQAEWLGLIYGLEKIEYLLQNETFLETSDSLFGSQTDFEIYVLLDSELVVKQARGEYKVKNEGLKTHYTKLKTLEKKLPKIIYSHIYREKNKEADRLVNEVLDKQN